MLPQAIDWHSVIGWLEGLKGCHRQTGPWQQASHLFKEKKAQSEKEPYNFWIWF
jgi:hypothetical protein